MKHSYKYLCKQCDLLWRKKDLDLYTLDNKERIRVCPKCGTVSKKISKKDRKMGTEVDEK